jgi:septum site-determining protein MinD
MSVYAIASGKGGVGKTTTAIALAACAGAADRSVVVVDADLGMADIATFLGLDEAGPTLHDVLAGDADVDAALRAADGFDVLPAGTTLEGYAAAEPTGLGDVVAELRDRYDVVILDAGAGLSHDTVLPLGLADDIVLVSTPDDVSIVDTDKTREMAERVGGRLRGVVLTKAVDTDLEGLSRGIDVPLLGVVPQDDAVTEAAGATEAVPAFAPDSPAGTAYMDVAADLFEVPVTAIEFGEAADSEESLDGPAAVPFAGEAGDQSAVSEPVVEEAETDPGTEADGPDDAGEGDSEAPPGDGSTPNESAASADDGDAGGEASATEASPDDPGEADAGGDSDGDSDDGSGGFLSRLFGRN